MKFKMITRDWKSCYSAREGKGWIIFANEDDFENNDEDYSMILTDNMEEAIKCGLSCDEIRNLINRMESEDVDGWKNVLDSQGRREQCVIERVDV
jgi:hypothetical protein